MSDRINPLVKEGWTGPGSRDGKILPLALSDDALHIDPAGRGMYEWWYFDAHLDTGHTIVVFFHAANPNPGMAGKSGMEIVLIRPDGRKTQVFVPYPKSEFAASRETPDVRIGGNYMRVTKQDNGLPVYEICVTEKDLGCRLTYRALVNGWKPGSGFSHFGKMGYFAWVVPFARAAVSGSVTDGGSTLPVTGVGYHDHNWLNFQFPRIINYWMWGRIYSENFTVSYAYIRCNRKMDDHAVKVLMLAQGEKVVLSTGEFDFITEEFEYNAGAKHRFPRSVTIRVPGEVEVRLAAKEILEAVDMLNNFSPVLRFVAKNIIRLKPGYFRLASDFTITVTGGGKTVSETGRTLHEIVMFKPVVQG